MKTYAFTKEAKTKRNDNILLSKKITGEYINGSLILFEKDGKKLIRLNIMPTFSSKEEIDNFVNILNTMKQKLD